MNFFRRAMQAWKARFAPPPADAHPAPPLATEAVEAAAEPTVPETVLCIPGSWTDRSDFLRSIVTLEPAGRYMFAGMLLADVRGKDHVPLELCAADPSLAGAFQIAAQGRIGADILKAVAQHKSVAYLHFPRDVLAQRDRMVKFCEIMRRAGGIAVKVESTGVAHTFERWEKLLEGTLFDRYTAAVTLIGNEQVYYSCGMHNFGFADCEMPAAMGVEDAAALMNRFNLWRLDEAPAFSDGHTFSLAPNAPKFRMRQVDDTRHEQGHLFFNPFGLWRLEPA
jgi:hypothetical protein